MNDPGSVILPEPLAYSLTWTTYGTWLPGDRRGWTKRHGGQQPPNVELQRRAARRMTSAPTLLDDEQRMLVEHVVAEHCRLRQWTLHAVNCRSNHLHVIVTAGVHPDRVRDQLKSWCSRYLNGLDRKRTHSPPVSRRKWWTERGSRRYLNDERSLEAAILYVRDAQDFRH